MEIVFSPNAIKDRNYWKQTGNKRVMKRISLLLADLQQHPFTGIGETRAIERRVPWFVESPHNR